MIAADKNSGSFALYDYSCFTIPRNGLEQNIIEN